MPQEEKINEENGQKAIRSCVELIKTFLPENAKSYLFDSESGHTKYDSFDEPASAIGYRFNDRTQNLVLFLPGDECTTDEITQSWYFFQTFDKEKQRDSLKSDYVTYMENMTYYENNAFLHEHETYKVQVSLFEIPCSHKETYEIYFNDEDYPIDIHFEYTLKVFDPTVYLRNIYDNQKDVFNPINNSKKTVMENPVNDISLCVHLENGNFFINNLLHKSREFILSNLRNDLTGDYFSEYGFEFVLIKACRIKAFQNREILTHMTTILRDKVTCV